MTKSTGPCVLCSETSPSKAYLQLENLKTRNSRVAFHFKIFEIANLQINVEAKKEICRLCHDHIQEIDSLQENVRSKKNVFLKRIGVKSDTPTETDVPLQLNNSKTAPKTPTGKENVGNAPNSNKKKPVSAKKSKPMPLSKKRDSGINQESPDVSMEEGSCYVKETKTTPGPKSRKRTPAKGGQTPPSSAKRGKTPTKPIPKPDEKDYGPFVPTDEFPIMTKVYEENPELQFIVTRMAEKTLDEVVGSDSNTYVDTEVIKEMNLKERDVENPLNSTEWSTILRMIISTAMGLDPKHASLFQDKVFNKTFLVEMRMLLVNRYSKWAFKGCLGYYRDDANHHWHNDKIFENLRSKLNAACSKKE